MQGNQEREPLAGPQPIPLIQILPDGRLAYVTLPMASLPQVSAPNYPAPQPVSQPQMSSTQNAGEIKASRDRWGCIIKTMGILMLLLALFGLVTRVCMAHKMRRKSQWCLWWIGLAVFLLMLLTAILGIRAGAKKTSRAAMCYLRFLVFFAVVFVIALVAASMLCIKMGEKHWNNRNKNWDQGTDYMEEDQMPPMDAPMPCGMPPQPPQPAEPGNVSVTTVEHGNVVVTTTEVVANTATPTVVGTATPAVVGATTSTVVGTATTTEAVGNSANVTEEAPVVKDFPAPPEGEMGPEPTETYPNFDPIEGRSRSGKKEKYGDRDEHRWTKEEVKEGMMLGMFVVVLLTMGLCCSCVFCALRLVKYSTSYEALFPRESAVPQFNYVHRQPMQPMQAMPPMQQMQPMQMMQPQVEMHHYQAAAPQVVQAVPLGQAGLYPNLAPIGSAVQYPRSS